MSINYAILDQLSSKDVEQNLEEIKSLIEDNFTSQEISSINWQCVFYLDDCLELVKQNVLPDCVLD
jgi:hypothetical protein